MWEPQLTQRVHVGTWCILRGQRGSHIPTLRAKYIPYSYMDPLVKDPGPRVVELGYEVGFSYFLMSAPSGFITIAVLGGAGGT